MPLKDSKKKGLLVDQTQAEVTPAHVNELRNAVMKAPVLPRVTVPYGQPSLDEWLHWFYDDGGQIVTVRFRGVYYEIAASLWAGGGFGVVAVKLKSNQVARLTPATYDTLPDFIRDAFPQWRKELTAALAGTGGTLYGG